MTQWVIINNVDHFSTEMLEPGLDEKSLEPDSQISAFTLHALGLGAIAQAGDRVAREGGGSTGGDGEKSEALLIQTPVTGFKPNGFEKSLEQGIHAWVMSSQLGPSQYEQLMFVVGVVSSQGIQLDHAELRETPHARGEYCRVQAQQIYCAPDLMQLSGAECVSEVLDAFTRELGLDPASSDSRL